MAEILSVAAAIPATLGLLSTLNATFPSLKSIDREMNEQMLDYQVQLHRAMQLFQVLAGTSKELDSMLERSTSTNVRASLMEMWHAQLLAQVDFLSKYTRDEQRSRLSRRLMWAVKDRERLRNHVEMLKSLIDATQQMLISSQMLTSQDLVRRQGAFEQTRDKLISSINLASSGLQTLYEHAQQDQIKADIIFIHGLWTSSIETWGGVNQYWPRHFLPHKAVKTRIITFDYHIEGREGLSRSNLLHQVKALIAGIDSMRQRNPIIFCAHSFGGLLLKSALAYCHRAQSFDDSCKGVLARTSGIIFLGLPSPSVGSSWLIEYLAKLSSPDSSFDQSLRPMLRNKFILDVEEMLQADIDLFRGLCSIQSWTVSVFYESKESSTRYGPSYITAPPSLLVDKNFDFLPGDHFTMCKFQTRDEEGYLAISGRLLTMISNEKSEDRNPFRREEKEGDEKHKRSAILEASQTYRQRVEGFLKQLRGHSSPYALATPKPQHSATWILKDGNFRNWRNGSARILQIYGPSGTGKTELAAQIVEWLANEPSERTMRRGGRMTLVHFISWDQGDRRAPLELLRALLLQLLGERPNLFKRVSFRLDQPVNTVEDLEELLLDMLATSRLDGVDLVLHGLDNVDQRSRVQIARSLTRLVALDSPTVRVLFTRRNKDSDPPHLHKAEYWKLSSPQVSFLNLHEISLEGTRDIEVKEFVGRRVKAMNNYSRLRSSLREELETRIIRMTVAKEAIAACPGRVNNFLWISLVIDLISLANSSSNITHLLDFAELKLKDLIKLYDYIIDMVAKDDDALQILHFLQVACRPLTSDELTFSVAIQKEHKSVDDVKEKQSLALSGVLVPGTPALLSFRDEHVSLFHSSLGEYISKDLKHGLGSAKGHLKIMKSCLSTLSIAGQKDDDKTLLTPSEDVNYDDEAFETIPFLRYAADFWHKHALRCCNDPKYATAAVEMLIEFIERPGSDWDRWRGYYTNFDPTTRLPKNRMTLRHIFAALNLLQGADALAFLNTKHPARNSGLREPDADGWTPLHYAVANSADDTVIFILDQLISKLDKRSPPFSFDQKVIDLAISKGNVPLLKQLLETDIGISNAMLIKVIDGRHWTAFQHLRGYLNMSSKAVRLDSPRRNWGEWKDDEGGVLHHTVRTRNLDVVRLFLRSGADISQSHHTGNALHEAARIGDEKIMSLLLKHTEDEASINAQDDLRGNTPLHLAAETGSTAIVVALLEAKAQISSINGAGETALHIAARYGHEEIIAVLLIGGAEVNLKDNDMSTALHIAAAGSWTVVVKHLLAQGADAQAKDDRGRAPLHLAASNGAKDVTRLLLASATDANQRDDSGQTPLHAAVESESLDTIAALIEAGADVNARDAEGKTPLHLALSGSASLGVVQRLLEAGANPRTTDADGQNPLNYARADDQKLAAAMLELDIDEMTDQ